MKLKTKIFIVIMFFGIFGITNFSLAYDPPIGIPDPGFGIEQTHEMYQGKTYDYNGTVGPYKDAGNGPYTHYVDNTDPNSTDSSNPYGDVTKPRKTFPATAYIAPGAVIEVHGGPYNFHYYLTANGEADKPIFLRGISPESKAIFGSASYRYTFMIRSHYVILENFEFVRSGPDIRPWYDYEKVHHVTMKNCELHGGDGAGSAPSSYVAGNDVYDVVYYKNKFHADNFDPNGGEFPEHDTAGIYAGQQSHRTWVLDNEIYGYSGDAIGGCHGCNYTATDLYVGRNKLHDTGENGVDFKEIENVVVSQNKIYGFKGLSSGSDGTAVVIHYGPNYSPKNAWFLFNEIYDATDKGIQVGGDQVWESYFIGNIVHNIHNSSGTGNAFMTWNSNKINLIGNVFYDIDNGINASGTITGTDEQLVLYNNIISNLSPGGYMINADDSTYRNAMEIDNNIFYQPGASAKFVWGATYDSLAQFKNATGKCQNCQEVNPAFIDPAGNNFQLSSSSPAIDKGMASDLYERYKSLYGGISIQTDYQGNPRPQGAGWDIGAYEYSGSSSDTTPPTAPSGLSIQ